MIEHTVQWTVSSWAIVGMESCAIHIRVSDCNYAFLWCVFTRFIEWDVDAGFSCTFFSCCHFPSYNCILKICDDEIHSAHNTFARTFSHTAATHRNIVREHFITFLFCHSEGLLIYVCICVRMRVRVVCVCICVNRIVRESSNMATIHDTW